MADQVDAQSRRRIMPKIKSKDTSPEMAVRKAVHAAGFRYRLHRADLPGKPDLAFSRHKLAVFVHGCFWHGHRCRRFRMPSSNQAYWTRKIQRNRERDARAAEALAEMGWERIVIWECELEAGTERLIERLEMLSASEKAGAKASP